MRKCTQDSLIAHDDTYIFSFAAEITPERAGIVTDFSKVFTVTVFEGVTLYATLGDRPFSKKICSALIDRTAKKTVCSIAAITEQTDAGKKTDTHRLCGRRVHEPSAKFDGQTLIILKACA